MTTNPLGDVIEQCVALAAELGLDVRVIGPVDGCRVKAVFTLRETPAEPEPEVECE